jgi:hypothetical protein
VDSDDLEIDSETG